MRNFGQFLVARRVLDEDAVVSALTYQSAHNPDLRALAVQDGLVTADDAAEIARQSDGDFLATAVRLEKVTRADTDSFLARSQQHRVLFGEALVAVGAMTRERLIVELDVYAQERTNELLAFEQSLLILETRRQRPATGNTAYERYVNTEALLACQRAPEELVNHDEPLFQTVHQVSELWMKLLRHELGGVIEIMNQDKDDLWRAVHLLRRIHALFDYLVSQVGVLETMHPADYMPIRAVLGNGSGMTSPGFKGIMSAGADAAKAFAALLLRRGVTAVELQQEPRRDYALYQLMQGLLDFDQGFQRFRHNHVLVAMREIGNVVGLAGTAVPLLMKRAQTSFFPELWEAIARLSEQHRAGYGATEDAGGEG
jgi:tryptophan 2,3-dioxygenase